MQTAIIVHGGAGAWDLTSERLRQATQACEEAARAAQKMLLEGASALDAVEKAIRLMEDSPVLDAGRGSYLNASGDVEMDALIMDGRTLDLGAVAAIQRVQNPISLARQVMENSEHTFLVGEDAAAFADSIGHPRCDVGDLLVGSELDKYVELRQQDDYRTESVFSEPGSMGDTVGAVAMDAGGSLAVGTSTGGTRKKLPGRVGDSPLVGSGGYADNRTAAVSATGYGEAIMKVVLSKHVCDQIEDGLPVQAACDAAIRMLADRVAGMGGVIAIDSQGTIGFAFNTDSMPHAYAMGRSPVSAGH